MKSTFFLIWVFLLVVSIPKIDEAHFTWPKDTKAAVVLTYDDALDCHLDVAVPQLDEFGLKGTFYCTGISQSLYNRLDEWRETAQDGHEQRAQQRVLLCYVFGSDGIH